MSNYMIAGIGNPGFNYRNTRHNIGFIVLEALKDKFNLSWKTKTILKSQICKIIYKGNSIILLKPLIFMNESGISIFKVKNYYNIPLKSIIVIHDDININFSNLKLSQNKGSGYHNGLKNITEWIGSNFIRFRIGIGQKPNNQIKLQDYVLSKFSQSELTLILNKINYYLESLLYIVENGIITATNLINQNTLIKK